ncbi:unnamed protein product [Ascophyllum nodosum]
MARNSTEGGAWWQEMADRLSELEGLAGARSDSGTLLREHQEEMLVKMREIRQALASESGELESVKAANEEMAKLRELIKRKDYRILHLTRALDAAST